MPDWISRLRAAHEEPWWSITSEQRIAIHNSIPQVLALAEAARNVSLSGVEVDDPRMHYVTVQVTRSDWRALRKALSE